jgi:hypothetical protein
VIGVRETNVPKPKQDRNFRRKNSFPWGDLLLETNGETGNEWGTSPPAGLAP